MKLLIFSFLFCGVITSFSINTARAAGITTHMFMADVAVDYVKQNELRTFILRNQDAMRNGTIFPDSGYIKGATYGEFAHWDRFHNGFLTYLDQTCAWPLTSHCEELLAFFFGTLSHGLSDVYFHRDFITAVSSVDFGGNYGDAHTYSDPASDMLSILDYGRGRVVPKMDFPTADLVKVFNVSGFPVPESEIREYTDIVYAGLVGERVASPFAYLYYKFKSPWAASNYYTAKGGVLDSATQVAEIWDQVWERLARYHRFLPIAKFNVTGNWPYVQFTLGSEADKTSLESTVLFHTWKMHDQLPLGN